MERLLTPPAYPDFLTPPPDPDYITPPPDPDYVTPPSYPNDGLTTFTMEIRTPRLEKEFNVDVMGAVIGVVLVTVLSVVVLIVIYMYKKIGTYRTYEQRQTDPEETVQMKDLPHTGEKE